MLIINFELFRADVKPAEVSDVVQKQAQDIVPGRIVRRARRQVSSQSQGSEGTGMDWLYITQTLLVNLYNKKTYLV